MHETLPSEQDVLDRIRAEMDRHLRENKAPEDVRGFLTQHWARLMTGIFMAKGNQDADWNAGWDTVNALLWSLSPKQGPLETEKMLRMLPTILARLHEGCSAISLPMLERDALFERLAMMHAAVARAGLKYPDDTGAGAIRAGSAADHDQPKAELARPMPLQRAVHDSRTPRRTVSGPLPILKLGDRIHFCLAGEDRILVVNWISPVGGMYLFTNEQGLDALTLTRARLAERFQAGTASLVRG